MSVRRRVAVIGIALAIIATAGILYFKPEGLNRTEPLIPSTYRTINGPYAVTYDFISPSHGWALVSTYESSTFFVFKTTNAAESWQKQYSGPPGAGWPRSLHFFDERNGFLYGGETYRTVDGGDHWQVVQSPGPGAQVSFCSPLEGWGQVFDSDGLHVYRTEDGGVTWHRTSADPPEPAIFQPFGGDREPAFRSGGEGWFGADQQPGAVVFVTHDGGSSWDVIDLRLGTDVYGTSVRIVGNTSVAVFVIGEGAVGGLGQTLLSSDGGLHWHVVAFPIPGLSSGDTSFVDTDHWWVFNSGLVYLTGDGGRSWTRTRDFDFTIDWRPLNAGAIDAKHAWRTLTSTANSQVAALAMTADGGLHWRLVNAPQP